MVRKAKPKKKSKAPRKAAAAFTEAALTKGELRKLNALKKSVGDQIGEKAFAQWLENKTKNATTVPSDQNAEMIADTLGKLVKDGGLKLPRGDLRKGDVRYLVDQRQDLNLVSLRLL